MAETKKNDNEVCGSSVGFDKATKVFVDEHDKQHGSYKDHEPALSSTSKLPDPPQGKGFALTGK